MKSKERKQVNKNDSRARGLAERYGYNKKQSPIILEPAPTFNGFQTANPIINNQVFDAIFRDDTGVTITAPVKEKKKQSVKREKTYSVNGKPISAAEKQEIEAYNKVVQKYNGNYMQAMRAGTPQERALMEKYGSGQIRNQLAGQTNSFGQNMADAYLSEATGASMLNNNLGAADYLTPRAAAQKAYDNTKAIAEAYQQATGMSPLEQENIKRNAESGYYDRQRGNQQFGQAMAGLVGGSLVGPMGIVGTFGGLVGDEAGHAYARDHGYNDWYDYAQNHLGLGDIASHILTPGLLTSMLTTGAMSAPTMFRNFGRSYLNATKGGLASDVPMTATVSDYMAAARAGATAEELAAIKQGIGNANRAAWNNMGRIEWVPNTRGMHLRTAGFSSGGYRTNNLQNSLNLQQGLSPSAYEHFVPGNRWYNTSLGNVPAYFGYRALDEIPAAAVAAAQTVPGAAIYEASQNDYENN